MNIYSKIDYRLILNELVAERKQLDSRVNFQQMAEFMRIPKSYLSRVIHGKAELSADQLFLACRYLDFNEQEGRYLHLLLEYERTGIKERKDRILQEVRTIQAENLDTKRHLQAPSSSRGEELTAYYLDPLIQLTHICLAIPRYQSNPTRLASDLNVPLSRLQSAIHRLEQLGIISRDKEGIRLLVENIHLPKDAPVYRAWRNQVRMRAMQRLDSIADEQAYSFTVLFSADDDVRREIQSRFLGFLKDVEGLVGHASQEDAYQLSFELFPWTKS